MIVLAFVACLQSDPSVCQEQNLVFAERMSPMACLMGAQPELAKWAERKPNWRVVRWRCETLDQREAKI